MRKIYTLIILLSIASYASGQLSANKLQQIISENWECNQSINLHIDASHTDSKTGITHIYFTQEVNGIQIINAYSSVHLDKNNKIVVFNNSLVCNAENITNSKTATLGSLDALNKAASYKSIAINTTLAKNIKPEANGKIVYNVETPLSTTPVYVLVGDELRLAWNCEIYNNETSDWWQIRVDAQTGEILNENNWTAHCNQHETHARINNEVRSVVYATATNKTNKKASTGATYNVFPFPVESPIHGQRQLMPELFDSAFAPFGWHDTDGVAGTDFTITRGNNVYAKEDTLARNQLGYSPDGGSSLVFDYPYDSSARARTNLNAAITNLFYWNNLIHDVFYKYGFTEAAGNFQSNNFGRGGLQRDPVHADAQDGSGTNNANFQTPVDGNLPRMQMFLWNPSGTSSRNLFVGNNLYNANFSTFGPRPFDTLTAPIVLVNDSTASPTLGCSSIKNNVSGKIALMYRGSCGYTVKVQNAQNAGAIAAIVINTSDQPLTMIGSSTGITIPSVAITKTLGDSIVARINAGDTNIIGRIFQSALFTKQFDSDFDNGVIVHEYGHGISIRLTGGPLNSSCLTGNEQAGEGWSDFFSLCLTAKASDSTLDGRGIGTYVFNQNTNGLGIRNYKYSRNMTINPTTYNSIKSLAIPHGVGSVWCTMLYDVYWDMVDKYGFNEDIFDTENGGNNMTLQLVVDALKLQKCNPGFVDMRNAVILADSIRYGGANKELLWKAFARRGLGASANQGGTSNTDGTEAYDLPVFGPPTGISENAWNTVKVWPNPANDFINITIPDGATMVTINIIDITGKRVYSNKLQPGSAQVQLGSLEKGVYLVQLTDGTNQYQTKLVISK